MPGGAWLHLFKDSTHIPSCSFFSCLLPVTGPEAPFHATIFLRESLIMALTGGNWGMVFSLKKPMQQWFVCSEIQSQW
jgi:hypothetical protein